MGKFETMKTLAEVKISNIEAVYIETLLTWHRENYESEDLDTEIFNKILNRTDKTLIFTQLELQRIISIIHMLSVLLYVTDNDKQQQSRRTVLRKCNEFGEKCQLAIEPIVFAYDPYELSSDGHTFCELTLMEIGRLFDIISIINMYATPDYFQINNFRLRMGQMLYKSRKNILAAPDIVVLSTIINLYESLIKAFRLKEIMPDSIKRDEDWIKKLRETIFKTEDKQ